MSSRETEETVVELLKEKMPEFRGVSTQVRDPERPSDHAVRSVICAVRKTFPEGRTGRVNDAEFLKSVICELERIKELVFSAELVVIRKLASIEK